MNTLTYPALGETLYEETLPNGLKIVVIEKKGFRRSHAIFATNYGGADRRFCLGGEWIDTPAGVAHFLEHKMFDMPDGTNVMAEFSARGASPNAFTDVGVTGYHFTGTDRFYENLRTLLTYVSTPYYTAESVEKEQGIIAQEIRMFENSPFIVGYYDLIRSLYAHHPLRDPVVGTVESIAQITPEILYHCHQVFYNPSNMVLCCVGDVDIGRIAALAEEILPSKPGEIPLRDYGSEESLYPAQRRTERTMAVAAPLFNLGAKLPSGPRGRERLRQQLLGEVALDCLIGPSSSLYNELYAQGQLGRDFGWDVSDAAGTLTVSVGGESRDPEAVCAAMLERVGRVAARGVDAAAFERVRRAHYGGELCSLDWFSGYAGAVFRGCFDGWSPLDTFALLEELTAEDAAAFLCEYVTDERIALSVVRPE